MNEQVKNYWFFESPKICFGKGSLSFLRDIKCKKCFIVTDKFIQNNLLHHVTEILTELGKEFEIFSEVKPDPREEMVLRGARKCREFSPDLLIAVGGGSSIDACKAIWILYERPDLNIDDMHLFMNLGLGKKAKMLAIPTTSGTGAETTWAIIITRVREDGSEIKLELANKEAIPTYAILDPIFTMGLPPKITAATGIDALAHVTEALISKVSNDFSEGLALKAIELLMKNLPIAYDDGKNLRAREAVHNAACIAGLSFGNSQVILGHSLGHSLGAIFHKPHGLCVGVVMIPVLQFNANLSQNTLVKEKLAKASKQLGIAQWNDDVDESCGKLFGALKELMSNLSFPVRIKDWGVSREELMENLDKIVDLTLESSSNVFGPRSFDKNDLQKILKYAFEGKDVDF